MGLKNTAMKFFWSDEMEEQQEEYTRPRLLKSGHLNIMVRTPKSFADVREYADSLMNGSAIMVCFDAVDEALRYRIFDYLNGVSYIINADVKKLMMICFSMRLNRCRLIKRKQELLLMYVPGLANK